jgi:DNA helicase-2/ATP-dependent DNA helicase PcrA
MKLQDFHTTLAHPNARGYDLNDEQKAAVNHQDGPLWLLAGPGSGKSEVLVTRTLRLVCVDDAAASMSRVEPRSILLTTFTKKAAGNLEDRLATYFGSLQPVDLALNKVDLADIRVGTIHSLCNDILQEFRYPAYQNVRLLDDVEQHLFAYHGAEIAKHLDHAFWTHFEHAVPNWSTNSLYYPSKWKRVKAASVLFNHIVEDYVDVSKMRAAGGHWATLAYFYEQYEQALREHHRCDYAHLQARFLDFINSPAGTRFLAGDNNHLPLLHVLVDEYQDTNPIQERIYLALANRTPYNLTVVGDDDQAIYRFRGGTVSCLVNFDQACQTVFGESPRRIQLQKNYRSHYKIVKFFNDYMTSFPEMRAPGVRAPSKQPMQAESAITGSYPVVSWISRHKVRDLPNAVADLIINHLLKDNVISDLSQCVLLMRSTKDSPHNAGPYLEAFERHGIPVYNPRSKSFMESEEVQCLLAALVQVVDAKKTFGKNKSKDVVKSVRQWLNTLSGVYKNPAVTTAPLADYIKRSQANLPKLCADNPGTFIKPNLLEIIYRIISREPFRTWRKDPVRNLRLSKVTRLFENYHSMRLDGLRANAAGTDLARNFRDKFYYMFVGYLIEAGIDDDEDEEVIVPQGYLPFMTIHQAKGLEFPFVIVTQLGKKGREGSAQILEHELSPFRQDLYPRNVRSVQELALQDDIRLWYVAYSRAEYALILVGTTTHIKNHVAAPSRDYTAFRRTIPVIS